MNAAKNTEAKDIKRDLAVMPMTSGLRVIMSCIALSTPFQISSKPSSSILQL
jgi:hypothetical protein